MVQLIQRRMPRYEGQMQSQRLRMVSDSELRMEQFQAERKDEKRRYEDALDRLKQVCSSPASCSTHTHRCRSTPAIKSKFFQGRAVLPSFPEVQSRRVWYAVLMFNALDLCLLGNSPLPAAPNKIMFQQGHEKNQCAGSDSSVLKPLLCCQWLWHDSRLALGLSPTMPWFIMWNCPSSDTASCFMLQSKASLDATIYCIS